MIDAPVRLRLVRRARPARVHGSAARLGVALAVVGVATAVASRARANPMEDVFGVGARSRGMGAVGTATAQDYSAVFYNPAGLAACPRSAVSLGWAHVDHQLAIHDDQAFTAPEPIAFRDPITLGLCSKLPLDFTLGLHFSIGIENPMALDQQSIDARPRFLMHDHRLDGMSIMLGVAYAILPRLSVGAAASVLANSDLNLVNSVPVITDHQVTNDLRWNLNPTAALYVGARGEPLEHLYLGFAYRSALYHQLHVAAKTRVELAGLLVDVDLLLQGAMWYSPQQLAFGAGYVPIPGLTLAADLTWMNWSAYPGPFIVASPGGGSTVAQTLEYPPREPPMFTDIAVPHFGIEYVWHELLALRAGYAFSPTPAPAPNGVANLLDADTHLVTVGAGVRWEPDPAADPTGPFQGALSGDAYFMVGIVGERGVQRTVTAAELNDFSFGGWFWNAGVSVTLEY